MAETEGVAADPIVAFLRERIAEDEAVARAAEPATTRRALREVAAKRALMDMHRPIRAKDIPGSGWTSDSLACEQETGPDDIAPTPFPCPTLRALATVYADHPDYRPEWRP
jgi:hypothetical protein